MFSQTKAAMCILILWETVCAHIERMNEADVILQKAGVENIAAERAEIQDTGDFFVVGVCESGGRIVTWCLKSNMQGHREYAEL